MLARAILLSVATLCLSFDPALAQSLVLEWIRSPGPAVLDGAALTGSGYLSVVTRHEERAFSTLIAPDGSYVVYGSGYQVGLVHSHSWSCGQGPAMGRYTCP